MNYPGDTASPVEVARWMATVAEEEYGLPGILPVMTSCVEITQAWTGLGDVKTVPGYLYATDHDSVGYFQQRPSMGWGTPAQLVKADYALRAFCKEAAKYRGMFSTTDPEGLGQWCQAVQRSAYPDKYALLGYTLASELLKETDSEKAGDKAGDDGWPQIQVAFNASGWAYDPSSGKWLRSDRDLSRDASGWVFGTPDKPRDDNKTWTWPAANDEPAASGTYTEMYPTRYNWRADVEAWARYLVNNYNVSCNTYYRHPPPWDRETTSLDVWGPGGRGDPIDTALGEEIFNLLFNDPNKPDIEWCIWQAWIWTRSGGWQPYGTDDFSWHYDHIHVTYE